MNLSRAPNGRTKGDIGSLEIPILTASCQILFSTLSRILQDRISLPDPSRTTPLPPPPRPGSASPHPPVVPPRSSPAPLHSPRLPAPSSARTRDCVRTPIPVPRDCAPAV